MGIVQAIEETRVRNEIPLRSCRILDCGCSFGQVSVPLASLGYSVLGIDLDAKAIEIAMARKSKTGFKNLRFEYADVCSYLANRPEETFHVIILGDFLEQLNQPKPLIRLLSQRLLRDGTLVITIPNGFGFSEISLTKPVRFMKVIMRKKGAPGRNHVQSFTTWGIRRLLSPEFKIIRFSNINFLPLGRSRLALIDFQLAERLPLFLGNSWILTAVRNKL